MGTATCPGCGAPIAGGAAFCMYCGDALPGAAASSSGGDLPPPNTTAASAALPSDAGPSRPPKRKHRLLWIIVAIVVVVIVVIAAIGIYAYETQPPIQVSEINIWAPDNVCGLNANPIGFDGWNGSTRQVQEIDFGMPNYNSSACTIVSVTTNTSGFVLSQIQVPLTIPAGSSGTSMNITIRSPGSAYSGYLNLVLS